MQNKTAKTNKQAAPEKKGDTKKAAEKKNSKKNASAPARAGGASPTGRDRPA